MESYNSYCFFSIPALLHQCRKACRIRKPSFPIFFFSISALLHQGTKAEKVRKSFISYFVWYFCFWPRDFGIGHWALDLWILESGLRIQDVALQLFDFELWTLTFGRWILDSGFWFWEFRSRFPHSPKSKVLGLWILAFGLWTLRYSGLWIQGVELQFF